MNPGDKFLRMRGCVALMLQDAERRPLWPEPRLFRNEIMTAGRAWVAAHMLAGEGASSQTIQQLALGTGTAAPGTGDSTLAGELTRKAIVTFDTSGLSATGGPYWAAQVDFGTGEANGTLGNVAMFNSSAGGTMLCAATYATFEKATSNTLGVTYSVTH